MEETNDSLSAKAIAKRLTAPTPEFWKKIRNRAIWLVGIAGTVILMAPLAPFTIPAAIVTGCQYIAFGGAVLGLGAQATKKEEPAK